MTNNTLNSIGSTVRSIVTSDIDQLSAIQQGKNRRYTQIKPGKLKGSYSECSFNDVQIFHEHLTVGVRVEAAPNACYMPFGAALANTEDLTFCGESVRKNSLLQATGGEWDACSRGTLNYMGAAFNRTSLEENYFHLFQREFPCQWTNSKIACTSPRAFNQYLYLLQRTLTLMRLFPVLGTYAQTRNMLNEAILHSALAALTPTLPYQDKLSPFSSRKKGVQQVIDYLNVHSRHVPTIAELCQVSGLSERNLQYAFKEYMGVSPMRYLRLVRLNGVRRELMSSAKKQTRIMDAALNWGFVELGRFSGEYRRLFHELPSETLKAEYNG